MRGNMSPIDYHALEGRDDEDVDDELLEVAIRRRKRLNEELAKPENREIGPIRYEEVWRLPAGTANVAAAVEAGSQPPDVASSSTTAASNRLNGARA
jgi:hypothetical protein